MPTTTTAQRVACPRNCGTSFLRQPIAAAVLHACPHSSYGRPYKNRNQRDEIEVFVGGPNAGEVVQYPKEATPNEDDKRRVRPG